MKNEQLSQGLHEYAQTRDRELRDRLFEGLLPLSKAIAAKFTGRGMPREDLEQVAAMGLLKALERYEPDRNLRFVTYAVPTITGDLRNYLRDKGSMVRAPRDARQRLYQMARLQERFEQEHLRTPSAMELAQEMGITPEEMMHCCTGRICKRSEDVKKCPDSHFFSDATDKSHGCMIFLCKKETYVNFF